MNEYDSPNGHVGCAERLRRIVAQNTFTYRRNQLAMAHAVLWQEFST